MDELYFDPETNELRYRALPDDGTFPLSWASEEDINAIADAGEDEDAGTL